MNILGKNSISAFPFYSGKILGFAVCFFFVFEKMGLTLTSDFSCCMNKSIGVGIYIIGFTFSFISLFNLGSSTRVGLPEENTAFKTGGLFRISRNPIYVGLHLMVLGAIIFTLNIWLALAGIYSFVVYHFIILSEEAFLEKRFGDEYLAYKQKVRRYL